MKTKTTKWTIFAILSIIGIACIVSFAAAETTLLEEDAEGGLSSTWHGVGNVTVANTTGQANNGSQGMNFSVFVANNPGGWAYLSENITNTSGDIVTMVFSINPTANIRQDFGLEEAEFCKDSSRTPRGPGIQWDTDSIGTLSQQTTTWSTHFGSWETYVVKAFYNTTASGWYYNVSRNGTLLAHSNPPRVGDQVQTLGCVQAAGGDGISYYVDDLIISRNDTNVTSADEAAARQTIEDAINDTLTGHTIYTNQTIYTRNQSDHQAVGIFDFFVVKGSKRWAFNYISGSDTYVNATSLGTTVNIWENDSLTTATIDLQVETLINTTK